MEIVLGLVLFIISCWLLLRVGAYWYARWPRRLDRADLDGEFLGLLLFGKCGAQVSFLKKNSADSIVFSKNASPGTHVDVLVMSSALTSDVVAQIRQGLSVLEARLRFRVSEGREQNDPLMIQLDGIDEQDYATLESVLRLIARELGHSSADRYVIESKGPVDNDRVTSYFGWRR